MNRDNQRVSVSSGAPGEDLEEHKMQRVAFSISLVLRFLSERDERCPLGDASPDERALKGESLREFEREREKEGKKIKPECA